MSILQLKPNTSTRSNVVFRRAEDLRVLSKNFSRKQLIKIELGYSSTLYRHRHAVDRHSCNVLCKLKTSSSCIHWMKSSTNELKLQIFYRRTQMICCANKRRKLVYLLVNRNHGQTENHVTQIRGRRCPSCGQRAMRRIWANYLNI